VELNTEEGFGFVGNGGPGGSGGVGDLNKVFGKGLELISVGHPNLCTWVDCLILTLNAWILSSLPAANLHTTLILALQSVEQSIGQLVSSLLDGDPSKSVLPVSVSTDLGSESLGDFLRVTEGDESFALVCGFDGRLVRALVGGERG